MKKGKKKGITRREFLKKAGYTAGAVGISAALPGFAKMAKAATKNRILIGRPAPRTGPIAAFAESSPWLDNRALAEINKDGGIYIGSTRNLENRIKQHTYGKVKSTKGRRPFQLIYHEKYNDYKVTYKREQYLKSGAGREWLRNKKII